MFRQLLIKSAFVSMILCASVIGQNSVVENDSFQSSEDLTQIKSFSVTFNETASIRAIRLIKNAQATYQATNGNGNYGTLEQLAQVGFIDWTLASGNKYGYQFIVTKRDTSAKMPAFYEVFAIPQRYIKTGRRSFYTNPERVLLGADLAGNLPTPKEPPIIEEYSCNGICEENILALMRTLFNAELTYQATAGNGVFASLPALRAASLTDEITATGTRWGYHLNIAVQYPTATLPASFKITAVPVSYPQSGIRSFFIDQNGILRGADRGGAPADENDPPTP